MMHELGQRYRDRSIEIVIETSAHGCDAWFLVDGTARSVPRHFPGHDMDTAIAETLRAAREWVDKRPRAVALRTTPLADGALRFATPAPRPQSH